jgi:ubiquinone/menaquinone biosynthesis C-methylase UbiE/DNA-binding XRE family transcriptional regulator
MIDKVVVGNRIAKLRKELGYSQAIFAGKLNVSTQAVSKWETGLALPDIEVLLNISWISKSSIHAILDGEDFIEPQIGIDRGLLHISKCLECPQCHDKLKMHIPIKQDKLKFSCNNGHSYDVVDGVIHFGSREIKGELWSLWLRNYEHYLEEQHHPGNPRYWQGDPHYREIMWQRIDKIRPRMILDIACGTGSGIKYIIERINWPVTIIMTDLSHRILKWNRVFYSKEWNNPYVDMVYLACDCAHLPLADNCIDIVFSNGGFESMQHKMMDGFYEGFRVLKSGAHAVYNISTIDDHNSENTKKWIQLFTNLDNSYRPEEENLYNINQWLLKCEKAGYGKNEAVKVYGELPAPTDDIFPFENEIFQWMAEYVIVSQK